MAPFVLLGNLIHFVHFFKLTKRKTFENCYYFNYFWLKAPFSDIMKQCFKKIFDVYIFCPFQKFS